MSESVRGSETMRGMNHSAACSGRLADGSAIARSMAASFASGGGGTFESQAMLTNTFKPVGILMGVVGGESEEGAGKERELSAVDLTQKPGEGERETGVVAAMCTKLQTGRQDESRDEVDEMQVRVGAGLARC